MDIKVGKYVRSKSGSIGKITKIEDNKFLYENKTLITWIGNVTKHSFNIIDLLEVGDIIEYVEQTEGKEGTVLGETYAQRIVNSKELNGVKEDIECNGIKLKSILTHEQFEANCYKVKGEENVKNN